VNPESLSLKTALLLTACISVAAAPVRAQASTSERILVMPFENTAHEARIYWLREASSLLLADDLNRLGANAITREQRLRAFERLQLPPAASLSHATAIKVGELLAAGQVVIGSLELTGEQLAVHARAIRLDTGRLEQEITDRGPVAELFAIFGRIARRLAPDSTVSDGELEKAHPPLPAFESYVKGLLAETPVSQIRYLETALKLQPTFDAARLALYGTYTEQGDDERALKAVQTVPDSSSLATRARFLGAIAAMRLKRYEEAFSRLRLLLERVPKSMTAAVLNNLGVVQLRRGASPQSGLPTYYFNKASQADPDDADYFFNLGYAYWADRDPQAAIYWLREAVRRNPADGDAHFVLGTALQAGGNPAEAARERDLARQLSSAYAEWERRPGAAADPVPKGLERVKPDLDLPLAQRVDTALLAGEQREQKELAAFHLARGKRLFEQENDREAVAELRRALYLSPYQAEAHLLLGRIYLRNGRLREAIDGLKVSLWSEESEAAHLTLAEAYLQAKNEGAARAEAQRALAMDPSSQAARKLLDRIASSPARPPR
jgi:tetratricopeptide (TPR) repeat protein